MNCYVPAVFTFHLAEGVERGVLQARVGSGPLRGSLDPPVVLFTRLGLKLICLERGPTGPGGVVDVGYHHAEKC